MKCPKCGFNSFDFLETCKKCGNDLQDHKSRFGLRSLLFPGLATSAPSSGDDLVEAADDMVTPPDSTDFGFDFMSEEDAEALHTAPPDAAAEADDGFDFPADEPGSDDPTASLAVDEDDAFDFSADTADEVAVTEDDLDFDSWDEVEDTDTKKPSGAGEDPSDPFDFRESAAGERAPEFDSALADPAATSAPRSSEMLVEDERFAVEAPDSLATLAGHEQALGLFDEPNPDEKAPADAAADWLTKTAEENPEEIAWAAETSGRDELVEFEPGDAAEARLLPALSLRITATVVDVIVLAVVFLLFLVAGELTLGDGSGFWLPSLATVVDQAIPYFLVLFALCFGYFTLFHFLTGQTPGKMLCELRVESANGTPLQFSQAFLRSIGGLFAMLPCGLGYLSVVFSRQGRGWNDRFAGSRLVPLFDPEDEESAGSLLET